MLFWIPGSPLTRRPGMTATGGRPYPATVLQVFAKFSAPRIESAKIV